MIVPQEEIKKSLLLNKLHFYLYITSFSFVFIGLFTLPKGHEIMEVLVILSFIVGLFNKLINKQKLLNVPTLWLSALLIAGLVIIINDYIHGDWGRYGRAFVYMVFFVLLRPQLPCIKQVVKYSVVIGGVFLGLLSLYQFKMGLLRVEGFTNAILFSQALLVLLIFNFYFFLRNKEHIRYFSLLSIGFLLVGLYLSQTRGVWLALILLLSVYLAMKAVKKPLKYLLFTFAIVVVTFSTYENSGFVRDKVDAGISDLQRAKDGQFGSSWGLRIVVWDSAVKTIKDNYLIGIGRDNFYAYKEMQVERGEVDKSVLNPALYHTHNQYLQSQLIRGIPGSVVLLLLLLYPWLHSGFFKHKNYLFKAISFAYIIYGLSDVPFEHLNTIYLYVLSMTLLTYFSSEESGEVA